MIEETLKNELKKELRNLKRNEKEFSNLPKLSMEVILLVSIISVKKGGLDLKSQLYVLYECSHEQKVNYQQEIEGSVTKERLSEIQEAGNCFYLAGRLLKSFSNCKLSEKENCEIDAILKKVKMEWCEI